MSHWTASGGLAPLKAPNYWFPHASGIVFNLIGKDDSSIEHADIAAITVAGITGDVTIWATPGGWGGKLDQPDDWNLIYKQCHPRGWPNHAAASKVGTVTFNLDEPLRIVPGTTMGLYMHTTGWGGMVVRAANHPSRHLRLDTRRNDGLKPTLPEGTYSGDHIEVHAGCAKTWSPAPFGEVRQWALQRELNGLLLYQPKWLTWSAKNHMRFPPQFRSTAETLRIRLCTGRGGLPKWAVEQILEFCCPDWFNPLDVNLKVVGQDT